ncbi:hypothetical protein ACEPPN_016393 [Leptodophora sp. 'Broadleaf-Isolate-01']
MRLQRCSIGAAASIEGSQDPERRIGARLKVEDGRGSRAEVHEEKSSTTGVNKTRSVKEEEDTVPGFSEMGFNRRRLGTPEAEG